MNAINATNAITEFENPKTTAINVGIKPLRVSPNKVIKANFLPPILKTLVTPGFLEPVTLGSSSPANLHTIIALEIEPKT